MFKPNENIITIILKPIGANKQMIRANKQILGANKQTLGAKQQIVGTNRRFSCFSLRQFVGANKHFVGANRQVTGRQFDGQPDRSLDRLVDWIVCLIDDSISCCPLPAPFFFVGGDEVTTGPETRPCFGGLPGPGGPPGRNLNLLRSFSSDPLNSRNSLQNPPTSI